MLNDDSIVELLDLSRKQLEEISSNWLEGTFLDNRTFTGPNDEFLIVFKEGGGAVYKDIEVFKKIRATGMKSSYAYFMFCPIAEDFVKNKEKFKNQLFTQLRIPRDEMNYTFESFQKLEDILHRQRFEARQEIERYFLGILAYCGDTVCAVEGGEWYLKSTDPSMPDTDWEPLIKLGTGETIDCFVDLADSLLLWDGEKFMPMLDLRNL